MVPSDDAASLSTHFFDILIYIGRDRNGIRVKYPISISGMSFFFTSKFDAYFSAAMKILQKEKIKTNTVQKKFSDTIYRGQRYGHCVQVFNKTSDILEN